MRKETELTGGKGTASTELTRRVNGVEAEKAVFRGAVPDPEVSSKTARRRFSQSYKIRILDQLDNCTKKGEKSVILRREGLYARTVLSWRRQRKAGKLEGESSLALKASPKNVQQNKRLNELELENERLKKKLDMANKIIDFQKKIAEIMEIPMGEIDGKN